MTNALSTTSEIVAYVVTYALALGALALYLRALERSVLRDPEQLGGVFIAFVLPAAFLGILPPALSQAPDWTVYLAVGPFVALALYRCIRTIGRAARHRKKPDGGAWKPDGSGWIPDGRRWKPSAPEPPSPN